MTIAPKKLSSLLLRCNTNPNMTEANDICGGGEVIFNTSHQNYIYSLSVQHQWLCSSVSKPFLKQNILIHLFPESPWSVGDLSNLRGHHHQLSYIRAASGQVGQETNLPHHQLHFSSLQVSYTFVVLSMTTINTHSQASLLPRY